MKWLNAHGVCFVAGILALVRALLEHKPASAYETRGFLRL